MFPLAGRIARGCDCPSIFKLDVLDSVMHHEDWLYCERHSWSHLVFPGLGALLVVNKGWHVQMMGDAVPSKLLVHKVAVSICVVVDCLADFGKGNAWLANIDANEHRLPGHLGKTSYLWVDLYPRSIRITEQNHCRCVTVAALLVAHNIHIHVVPRLQHIRVRHSMSYHVVHRRAQALRVVHEVDGGRIGTVLHDEVVGYLVDLVEAGADLGVLDHLRDCSRCEVRRLPEGRDLLRGEDVDRPMEGRVLLSHATNIRRPLDVIGDCSRRRDGVSVFH